jgi:hypothetical protein
MHYLLILENSKIYIKFDPTCFGPRPSSGSLHLGLVKVTLMLKQSVKLRRYVLYGGVVACYVCVLCAVQGETRPAQHTVHSTNTIPGHNVLKHQLLLHYYSILPIGLT